MKSPFLKRILVTDVAAESGGALSVLSRFHQAVMATGSPECQWLFLLSKPRLAASERVEVQNRPWIKRSHFHRMLFEFFGQPWLIWRRRPDVVFSLQNLAVLTGRPQVIYLHQSIPFIDYRFSFRRDRTLWFIQNIQKPLICWSVRRARLIVVQSQWMRDKVAQTAKISPDKIMVLPPDVDVTGMTPYQDSANARRRFFYPAIAREYKNHQLILQACARLQQQGIDDYELFFTIQADENDYARQMAAQASNLGVKISWLGQLDRAGMSRLYHSSVLLFPSFLETVGLPLKEAKALGGIVLAGDHPYAREALGDYANGHYFDSPEQLADLMKACLDGGLTYHRVPAETAAQSNTWEKLVHVIQSFS